MTEERVEKSRQERSLRKSDASDGKWANGLTKAKRFLGKPTRQDELKI